MFWIMINIVDQSADEQAESCGCGCRRIRRQGERAGSSLTFAVQVMLSWEIITALGGPVVPAEIGKA